MVSWIYCGLCLIFGLVIGVSTIVLLSANDPWKGE